MKNWLAYIINHSQKNQIVLYCRQKNESVEIFITDSRQENKRILIHDLLWGSIEQLTLDQYSTKINWQTEKKNFENIPCEFDMVKARKENGYTDKLDYLHYHIANAINSTLENRGFSRHLKKNIIGTWNSNNFYLTFNEKGEYYKTGTPSSMPLLDGSPKEGMWTVSRNMLFLLDKKQSGYRIQIIDIKDFMLVFHGTSEHLYYLMTKK